MARKPIQNKSEIVPETLTFDTTSGILHANYDGFVASDEEPEVEPVPTESYFDFNIPPPARHSSKAGGRKAANAELVEFILAMPVGSSTAIPLEGRDIKVVKTAVTTAQRRVAEKQLIDNPKKPGTKRVRIAITRRYVVAPDPVNEGSARIWHIT